MPAKGWKYPPVPEDLYEKLQRKAEREGKTVAQVLRELLSQAQDLFEPEEKANYCLLCGRPSGTHKICDECFYAPEVIRPQVMGALFVEYRLRVLETTGNNLSFDDFIALMDEQTAKSHGITDEEWTEWTEWLEWREKHRQDPLLRYTPEWKQWVLKHPIKFHRHLGTMLGVKKREGRSDLQSVGEIFEQVFPLAFKGRKVKQEWKENASKSGEIEHP